MLRSIVNAKYSIQFSACTVDENGQIHLTLAVCRHSCFRRTQVDFLQCHVEIRIYPLSMNGERTLDWTPLMLRAHVAPAWHVTDTCVAMTLVADVTAPRSRIPSLVNRQAGLAYANIKINDELEPEKTLDNIRPGDLATYSCEVRLLGPKRPGMVPSRLAHCTCTLSVYKVIGGGGRMSTRLYKPGFDVFGRPTRQTLVSTGVNHEHDRLTWERDQ